MKHFYFSLRIFTLATLLLIGMKSAQAWDVKVGGVKFNVYIHGYGYAAVADSAIVALDNDKNLSGIVNIPSSVTYEYKWTEKDSNGEYITYTRDLSAPVIGIEDGYISGWNNQYHGAFYHCTKITKVIMPNSMKYIGQYAFYECNKLTSVVIPNSVTTIGLDAFAYSALTSVDIPNSVTTIRIGAFSNCSSLKSVDIPNSVTTIEGSAFSCCDSLSSVTLSNSITTISECTFAYCPALKKVTIPDLVTSIGEMAFIGCDSLSYVTLGNSITTIKLSAFEFCSALKSVNIPSSVKTIGEHAFDQCYNLTRIDITDLDAWCEIEGIDFYYPHHLYLNGQELTDLIIPSSVTAIRDLVFASCSGLTSVIIPDSVTSIGFQAFDSCSELKNVVISNSVTTIEPATFNDCGSLSNVTIGKLVTNIEHDAFDGCFNLIDITCLAKTPPTAAIYYDLPYIKPAFCNYNATLRVPKGSVNVYKSTQPWCRFSSIVGIEEETSLGDVDGDGQVNIEDMTSLINGLLNGIVLPSEADVDGDGRVNIDDVTALINYLLSDTL